MRVKQKEPSPRNEGYNSAPFKNTEGKEVRLGDAPNIQMRYASSFSSRHRKLHPILDALCHNALQKFLTRILFCKCFITECFEEFDQCVRPFWRIFGMRQCRLQLVAELVFQSWLFGRLSLRVLRLECGTLFAALNQCNCLLLLFQSCLGKRRRLVHRQCSGFNQCRHFGDRICMNLLCELKKPLETPNRSAASS